MFTFQDIKIEDAKLPELKNYCRDHGLKIKIGNKEYSPTRAKLPHIIEMLKSKNIFTIPVPKNVENDPTPQPTPTITKEPNIMEILGLTPAEQLEIESALKFSNMPMKQLIKLGALMKARKINSEAISLSKKSPEELRNTTLSGAAFANLKKTAEKIIAWNQSCYNNDLRIYLNASIMRMLTGSNLNTIKDFLENFRINQDEYTTIDEHNKYYGLTENDNRKGRDEFGNRIKIGDLINQATSKPSVEIPVESPQDKPVVEAKPLVIDRFTSPKEFAELIDALENETEIKVLCEQKMTELRNQKMNINTFYKEVKDYREELMKLKLTAINTYRRELTNPHTLSKDETEKPGCEYKDGQLIAEVKHIALKYLTLTQEENALRKTPKSEQ